MGSAVCCMVSAPGLAARRVAPACTGPFVRPHRGLHFFSGPSGSVLPTPLPEDAVLSLQQTFYGAPCSVVGSHCKNENRPGSLRRECLRVLDFKLLAPLSECSPDAESTQRPPGALLMPPLRQGAFRRGGGFRTEF